MNLEVTDREYHTLQAALHCWRGWLRGSLSASDPAIEHLDALATNGSQLVPLSAVETDNLRMRLQVQADPAAQVERQCELETLQDDLAFLLLLLDRADRNAPYSCWMSSAERERLDLIRAELDADPDDDPGADMAQEMMEHRGPTLGLNDLCPEERGE